MTAFCDRGLIRQIVVTYRDLARQNIPLRQRCQQLPLELAQTIARSIKRCAQWQFKLHGNGIGITLRIQLQTELVIAEQRGSAGQRQNRQKTDHSMAKHMPHNPDISALQRVKPLSGETFTSISLAAVQGMGNMCRQHKLALDQGGNQHHHHHRRQHPQILAFYAGQENQWHKRQHRRGRTGQHRGCHHRRAIHRCLQRWFTPFRFPENTLRNHHGVIHQHTQH